ncbi:MAG: glycosyltransferase N-terminal domain-containing protein [Marinoscillum sp.]
MHIIYRLSIWAYHLIIQIVSIFNDKAQRFVQGRRDWQKKLQAQLSKWDNPRIWIHAASLGEYEQGKPLISALSQAYPNHQILLTFFSPSGFENYKLNSEVDFVAYLPLDSPKNACEFIQLVNPSLAIFIKYEFWYFYMMELQKASIPLLLVSSIFRKNQMFFHPLGGFYLKALQGATHCFVQDEQSVRLLESHGIAQVTLAGDTRFDRVLELSTSYFNDAAIAKFVDDELVMVLGSVWPSDWQYLEPLVTEFAEKVKFIIAPHHIENENLKPFLEVDDSIKYTEARHHDIGQMRVLVIDNIGMLSSIYRYAQVAFVGGAFRGALHNVLEPAVYGIPVIFADHPANDKFIEAKELVAHGGGITIGSVGELSSFLQQLISNSKLRESMGNASGKFVKERSGATTKIMKEIDLLL